MQGWPTLRATFTRSSRRVESPRGSLLTPRFNLRGIMPSDASRSFAQGQARKMPDACASGSRHRRRGAWPGKSRGWPPYPSHWSRSFGGAQLARKSGDQRRGAESVASRTRVCVCLYLEGASRCARLDFFFKETAMNYREFFRTADSLAQQLPGLLLKVH
jgi:hypothetical protein